MNQFRYVFFYLTITHAYLLTLQGNAAAITCNVKDKIDFYVDQDGDGYAKNATITKLCPSQVSLGYVRKDVAMTDPVSKKLLLDCNDIPLAKAAVDSLEKIKIDGALRNTLIKYNASDINCNGKYSVTPKITGENYCGSAGDQYKDLALFCMNENKPKFTFLTQTERNNLKTETKAFDAVNVQQESKDASYMYVETKPVVKSYAKLGKATKTLGSDGITYVYKRFCMPDQNSYNSCRVPTGWSPIGATYGDYTSIGAFIPTGECKLIESEDGAFAKFKFDAKTKKCVPDSDFVCGISQRPHYEDGHCYDSGADDSKASTACWIAENGLSFRSKNNTWIADIKYYCNGSESKPVIPMIQFEWAHDSYFQYPFQKSGWIILEDMGGEFPKPFKKPEMRTTSMEMNEIYGSEENPSARFQVVMKGMALSINTVASTQEDDEKLIYINIFSQLGSRSRPAPPVNPIPPYVPPRIPKPRPVPPRPQPPIIPPVWPPHTSSQSSESSESSESSNSSDSSNSSLMTSSSSESSLYSDPMSSSSESSYSSESGGDNDYQSCTYEDIVEVDSKPPEEKKLFKIVGESTYYLDSNLPPIQAQSDAYRSAWQAKCVNCWKPNELLDLCNQFPRAEQCTGRAIERKAMFQTMQWIAESEISLLVDTLTGKGALNVPSTAKNVTTIVTDLIDITGSSDVISTTVEKVYNTVMPKKLKSSVDTYTSVANCKSLKEEAADRLKNFLGY